MNIKEQIIDLIDDTDFGRTSIEAAMVRIELPDEISPRIHSLPVGYNHPQFQEFLSQLDFEVDDTVFEMLEVNIWLSDGGWITEDVGRGFEDGDDDFYFLTRLLRPEIPSNLR